LVDSQLSASDYARPLPSPQRHRHKKLPVVAAAIAREMAAFLRAIGGEVAPA